MTIIIFLIFISAGIQLENSLQYNTSCKTEMKNAILMTDIAAISVLSSTDYIPACCWQQYLPEKEKTPEKIRNRPLKWKDDFFSYLFNIDPAIGVFTYNNSGHSKIIFKAWKTAVLKHPNLYYRYHSKNFLAFLLNYNFDLGLDAGLKYSRKNLARITVIEYDNELVREFIQDHGKRYVYEDGVIYLKENVSQVTTKEKNELQMIVGESKQPDVDWMVNSSQIPRQVYHNGNKILAGFTYPVIVMVKNIFKYLFSILTCLTGLIILFMFRKRISPGYLRFSFKIMASAGIIHIMQRFLSITDPIFRFGVVSVIFLFFILILIVSGIVKQTTYDEK